jgi:hypothetical protein
MPGALCLTSEAALERFSCKYGAWAVRRSDATVRLAQVGGSSRGQAFEAGIRRLGFVAAAAGGPVGYRWSLGSGLKKRMETSVGVLEAFEHHGIFDSSRLRNLAARVL